MFAGKSDPLATTESSLKEPPVGRLVSHEGDPVVPTGPTATIVHHE
jgi:hypothetical protein